MGMLGPEDCCQYFDSHYECNRKLEDGRAGAERPGLAVLETEV